MDFVKKILILFFSLTIAAKTILPELTAKQNIQNIKYLTKAEDITFYVKSNKILSFSSNFKAYEIIKEDTEVEYGVIKHPHLNLYLITAKSNAYENLSLVNEGSIYLFSTEDKKLILIGKGSLAKFNFDGSFITFFNRTNTSLHFLKTSNPSDISRIKLNSSNIFFNPQIEVFDLKNIYFTDLNNEKNIGLLQLDFETQKRQTIFKGDHAGIKLELASSRENLYILETTYKKLGYTNLYALKRGEVDISKRDFLFDFSNGSSFHLSIFKDKLLFISNTGINSHYSELFSFDLKTKTALIHSDLSFVSSYFYYEENLFIPFRETVYAINNADGTFIINNAPPQVGGSK